MQKIYRRLSKAVQKLPSREDWLWGIALLGIYGLVYLPIGLSSGFLTLQPETSLWTIIGVTLRAFLMPGITEEVAFRVLLIPHPSEEVSSRMSWLWIAISWISFVLYHLNWAAPAFFREPIFLGGAGLVGIVCTIAYLKSGSLWPPVVLHWLIVVVWLLLLGGLAKFQNA